MNCRENYQALVDYLSQHLEYGVALANSASAYDRDLVIQVLLSCYQATDRSLPFLKNLVWDEFATKCRGLQTETILRGGVSVPTRYLTAYMRLVGRDYLVEVLSDTIMAVINDEEMDLEVNPERLRKNYCADLEDELQDQILANQTRLQNTTQLFLDRILDPAILQKMPTEVRAVAHLIHSAAKEFCPELALPLVGGLVMLRYFSPSIVSPEKYLGESSPSNKARRNLILIAKILQNCSNGVRFGPKEEYMSFCNTFVDRNQHRFATYLNQVIVDPLQTDPSTCPFERFHRPHSALSFDVGSIDFQYLTCLHGLVDQCATTMIAEIGRTSPNKSAVHTEFVAFLATLGPAPALPQLSPHTSSSLPIASSSSSSSSASASPLEIRVSSSSSLLDDGLLEPDEAVPAPISTVPAEDLLLEMEKQRWFFTGPPSREKYPVLYVIVERFKVEYFHTMDILIQHVHNVLQGIRDQRYLLVVDMSWTRLSKELKETIIKQLGNMNGLFERKYKKNLHHVYIVHPSSYSRAVVIFLRAFTSSKLKRKITEVFDWHDLQQAIKIEDILLPPASRDYITRAYSVVKVNAKNKEQKRLIKFTSNTLLNIDPKCRRIQNEKFLAGINEISTELGSLEIFLKFTPESTHDKGVSKRKASLFQPKSSAIDRRFRTYRCASLADKDGILVDIFSAGFNSRQHPSDQLEEYRVQYRGQSQVWKLTCDSLLMLDRQYIIKTEVSFAGIHEIVEDSENPKCAWLRLKKSGKQRKVESKGTIRLLVSALRIGVEQYARENMLAIERDGNLYRSTTAARATARTQ